MEPTKESLIAMYTLLGPLVFVLAIVSYYSWLRYLDVHLPKYVRSSEQDPQFDQCQTFRLPRLPDEPVSFIEKHPLLFLYLTMAFVVLGICILTTAAVATYNRGGYWAIIFSNTPAILSMTLESLWAMASRNTLGGAFSKFLPFVFLSTVIVLIIGVILSIWLAPVAVFVIILPAIIYRGWLVWEWGRILRDTKDTPIILFWLILQVAVFGCTFLVLGIRLAQTNLASAYAEMIIISYVFTLPVIPLLSTSTFHLRRRYMLAVKEAREAHTRINSTTSLGEGSGAHRARKEDDLRTPANSNQWANGRSQAIVHDEGLGYELRVRDVI